ncbi:DUF4097 family beta strand repeat-containing protein [Thalassotalea ganghwensis]
MLQPMRKLVCMGFILTSISTAAQADVSREFSKTFQVDDSSALRLQNINGKVAITGWDRSTIEVNATITADDEDDLALISVETEQTGDTVSVETKYKERRRNRGSSGEVEYKVYVPSQTNLSDIELVNGSLDVEKVFGKMKVELVNGSLTISDAKSDIDVASVNGSINVNWLETEKVSKVSLETVNGSIKLGLPSNVSADVSAETMHGSIKNDFGLQVEKRGFIGKELNGIIAGGQIDINIESVNGSVKILSN